MFTGSNNKTDLKKSIRINSAFLLLITVVLPPLGVLLWAVLMKQYGKDFRIWFFILSGAIPTILLSIFMYLVFGALLGDKSSSDIIDNVWAPLLYVPYLLLVLPFGPTIYSLIWPLGRSHNDASSKRAS